MEVLFRLSEIATTRFSLQRRQRALRGAEIAAKQEQQGRCSGDGRSQVTMKSSVRAGGVGVEICRRMGFRSFARAIREVLFRIPSAGIQHGQTKMR